MKCVAVFNFNQTKLSSAYPGKDNCRLQFFWILCVAIISPAVAGKCRLTGPIMENVIWQE